MRRLLPWALLGLLGAGVVVGATVGALGAPSGPSSSSADAQAFLARVLVATADAGTAHLDYSHVTTSTSPLLRDVLTGRGVVNFISGDVQVTEVDRQPFITSQTTGTVPPVLQTATAEEIGIGRTMYQAVAQEGTSAAVWMKLTTPRDPTAELGLQTALNASVALGELGGTVRPVRVTKLGPATVDGARTTKFEVQTAPVCPSALTGPQFETQEPSTLWLDPAGRLVKVTTVVHQTGRLTAKILRAVPTLAHIAPGASTTTSTLRFSAFGEPVRITAPTHVLSIPSITGSASSRVRCSS